MRKARLLKNLQKCTLGGAGAGATQLAQKCTLGGAGGAGGLGAGAGVGHELREIVA